MPDSSVKDAQTLIASARRLTDLDRHKEATPLLDKAANLLADSGGNRSGEQTIQAVRELALLLERTGRFQLLREVLAGAEVNGIGKDQIGLPAAAIALQDGALQEAKRLLLSETPEAFPVRWYRLMVRIADGLSDFDGAFEAALAMKRRVKGYDEWRRRAALHLEWVRLLGASITPEWANRLPVLERSERGPAFLVGFPRSGTTLLDTFLMGHPDISVVEEKGMIRAAQSVVGDVASLADRTLAEMEEARSAYFGELDLHVDPDFGGVVLDKLPLNMIAAPLIHCLFQDSRFVFARRHPCDAVLSCFFQGFALNDSMACFLDLADAATYYDAAMRVWTSSCETLSVRTRTVAYERLIADPEAELRPAIDFLSLEWRDELLDHQATARSRGAISTPSYNQVTEPLSHAPCGRWRRYEKQLAPVLPTLLPWAKRLGYSD